MQAVFDPEVAARLLDDVADGVSVTAACARHGVARRTFRSWLERDREFGEQYEAARKLGIDWHVDQMIELAERVEGSDSAAAVNAARLKIDTVKWISAKLLPARYG